MYCIPFQGNNYYYLTAAHHRCNRKTKINTAKSINIICWRNCLMHIAHGTENESRFSKAQNWWKLIVAVIRCLSYDGFHSTSVQCIFECISRMKIYCCVKQLKLSTQSSLAFLLVLNVTVNWSSVIYIQNEVIFQRKNEIQRRNEIKKWNEKGKTSCCYLRLR